MSWNGQIPVQANWSGVPQLSGDETLYTTPVPSTTSVNPKIGIVDGNEIDLPTSYNELNTSNLNTTTINGNPVPISAENWSLYKAIHDVEGQREEIFNSRQYAVKDFLQVYAGDIYAKQELLPLPNGGNLYADVLVDAPLGNISTLYSDSVYIGGETHEGSLVVKGGTTLDGGVVHGTSIGCLPVSGVNTMRLDVLPVGIDIVSPLYITIDALGVANFSAGGALSLAGGDYIEYNSDEHYFINTSAGNDFTDIYVGNIHPAYNGTDNLRINAGGSVGRYVRVDDGLMIQSKAHKASQFDYLVGNHYDVGAVYVVDDEVDYQAKSYKCLLENSGFLPTQTLFTPWDDITPYVVGNLVQQLLLVFRCIADITGGDVPVGNPTNWVEVGNYLTPVWEFIENFEDNQYSFKSDADTYGWSLIKKKGQEGIRIMRNNVATTDFDIGRLYDDTFYQPRTSALIIDSDVNMNLYSLLNAQKIQPSQLDVAIEWVDNQTYEMGEYVVVGTDVYQAITKTLNLNPTGSIPSWDNGGITYEENNVVQSDGKTFGCIVGYTTSGSDNAPEGDTDHWVEQFAVVDMANYWAFQRVALNGGVMFPAVSGDLKYYSLVKPAGSVYTSLWITERNAGTNELTNAGMIYDTGLNVPVIGGATSLSVLGDLDMINYNVSNVGTLRTENIGAVATGSGLINILDQIQGTGKSIQNFDYLNLISPATGDDATIDLRTTANDIGLRLTIDANTGEASIRANLGVPLTITTDNKLYLNGDAGIQANVLSMAGDIAMGSNDITGCNDLTTNSINTIANLFRRGNFASIVDQTFTAGSTNEQQVQMTETLGTTLGVSLNATTFEIEVDADGSYKVEMDYQLTSSGGSHTHTYFWVKNNGTAIPVSTQQTTIRNSEVQCLSYSRIFQLSSGDKLTFWWNSSNSNDYLYNTAQQNVPPFAFVRPRQPSVSICVVSC